MAESRPFMGVHRALTNRNNQPRLSQSVEERDQSQKRDNITENSLTLLDEICCICICIIIFEVTKKVNLGDPIIDTV